MELTPEEKEKIRLEEKERYKAQQELKFENTKNIGRGCLGLSVIIVVVLYILEWIF